MLKPSPSKAISCEICPGNRQHDPNVPTRWALLGDAVEGCLPQCTVNHIGEFIFLESVREFCGANVRNLLFRGIVLDATVAPLRQVSTK